MGFGGSASAMVHSVKMNLAQRRAKKLKKGIDSAKRIKTEYNFAKVSDEELEILKTKIRAKAKKQRMNTNIGIFIMCLIIIYLLTLFF